jgi:hypothetical protein
VPPSSHLRRPQGRRPAILPPARGAATDRGDQLAASTRSAERGRSERTPWIALSGVTLAVAALVVVILVAAFLVFYLA